ncbi:MAG: hypothetical protein ACRCX2_17820 [Paraclostridium sp.]
MKVKCIEVGESKFLKLGEIYEVVDDVKQYLLIKDKDGGEVLCLKKYFESVKEEGFNAQNTTINIAGINFNCKDTPCMFATKNWNVKEDKVMNGFEKCTTKEMCESAMQLLGVTIIGSCSVEELFKNEDKMEEVRVVRKLEDLDKENNCNGIYLSYNKENGNLDMKYGKTTFCYWTENDTVEVWVGVLKAMGFKFEYKPLRTKEEVKAEMLSKCKEFKFNGFNYYIKYVQQDKRYYVSYDCFNNILGALYFDKETANEYCNELNEIIGVGK